MCLCVDMLQRKKRNERCVAECRFGLMSLILIIVQPKPQLELVPLQYAFYTLDVCDHIPKHLLLMLLIVSDQTLLLIVREYKA